MRGGATRLAVATAAEAEELRSHFPEAPILVMGALTEPELRRALAAGAEVAVWREGFRELCSRLAGERGTRAPRPRQARQRHGPPRRARPRGCRRAGPGLRRGPGPGAGRRLDPLRDRRRARRRLPRRAARTPSAPSPSAVRELAPGCRVHAANSAATMREPASHFDMVRCGVAVYGLDPFGEDPAAQGLSRRWSCAPTSPTSSASSPGRAPATGAAGARRRTPGSGCCRSATATACAAALTNNAEVLVRRPPLPARRHRLDGQHHDRPRAADRGRAGRRGGADRRPGLRADPRRGAGPAARRRSTTRSPAGSRRRVPRAHGQ